MWRVLQCFIILMVPLALVLAGCGGEEDPVAAAQKRVGKDPENIELRIAEVAKLYDSGHEMEGVLLLNEGLSLFPDNIELLRAMSDHYVDWAARTDLEQKYSTAQRYLERLIELGEVDAHTYARLAWVYRHGGQFLDATIMCKKALSLRPDYKVGIAEYALVCLESGKFEQAVELSNRLLADDPDNWNHLSTKFKAQFNACDYEESLETIAYMRALAAPDQMEWLDEWTEYIEPLVDDDVTREAWHQRRHIAYKLGKIGRYDLAIKEYKKALEIVERDGTRPDLIGTFNEQVAFFYQYADQDLAALPYLQASIPYLEEANRIDRLPVVYNHLAGAYSELAEMQPQDRDYWLTKRLEACKLVEKYAPETNNEHIALHALGNIVRTQLALYGLDGVDPVYRDRLKEHLPRDKQVYGCDIASVVYAEARLCIEQGEYERARDFYLNALYAEENEGEFSTDDTLASIYSSLGLTCRKLGDYEGLFDYSKKGLSRIDAIRSMQAVDAFKRTVSAETAANLHRQVVEAALALDEPVQALTYVERAKGRSLLDLLGTQQFLAGESDSASKYKAEQTQFVRVNQLAAMADEARTTGDEIKLRGIERTLSIEKTKYKRLKQNLESAEKNVLSFEYMPSLDGEQFAAFAEGFTFVSYTLGGESVFVIVVNEAGVHGLTLKDINLKDVTRLAGALKKDVLVKSSDGRDLAVEQAVVEADAPEEGETEDPRRVLYERLFKPVEPFIDSELVYICPDDSLNFVPFEMLLDEEERPLLRSYAFAYTASGSVLKFCMDREQLGRDNFLGLGNPNLENPALRLYHAENEVNTLGALFPGAEVLTTAAASETAFKQLAGNFDVLHLACHGELNLDDPMLTSLRLAPDAANDGYLHAGEVFDLDLQASLVVLSACESGLGDLQSGNELMGLTRAFLYAGAPAVVSSLWKVDDRSTAFLMEAFYKNLRTMNKAEALRQAKLATIKEFPEPFHWAAFRLEGDYR